MKKVILFDLDGTILDTLEDLTMALNYVLRHFELPLVTMNEAKAYLGYGADHFLSKALGKRQDLLDAALKMYKPYLESHSDILTKPYYGIMEVISKLGLMSQLGVVSNKHQEAVNHIVDHYFPKVFDVVIGNQEGLPKKPDPAALYKAMETFFLNGVKMSDAIYIGDSEVDILTAQDAGMDVIAVTWGFRDKAYLETFNPNYIVDKPLDILKVLGVK